MTTLLVHCVLPHGRHGLIASRQVLARRDGGLTEAIGPWRTTVTTVQPSSGRADLASNQTVQALIERGVHPSNAEKAIGNPQLAAAMLQKPSAYREPGTPATRLIEERCEMGVAGSAYG
jgi:hypothetical protein